MVKSIESNDQITTKFNGVSMYRTMSWRNEVTWYVPMRTMETGPITINIHPNNVTLW